MTRKTRAYSLIFGKPVRLPANYWISPLRSEFSKTIVFDKYYDESDPNAYLIDKHNISFKVSKKEKSNNKAEITIDNLSEGAKAYLTSHKNDNLAIVLKIGYNDGIKLVFQGTMTECVISQVGNTSKTKIVATDGGLNTSKAYTSRVYPAGTKAQKVVDDLIQDLATPRGSIAELPFTAILKTEYTIFGETNRNLKRLLEGNGYVGTINNGIYSILPLNKRLVKNVAYISPETGLIGSVQALDVKGKVGEITSTDTSKNKRIRFTCQVDATLNPQESVYVKDLSVKVDGSFKIEKSVFVSSGFERGSWFVTVDAVELDATVVI